jgi:hypothetical protein
MTTDSYHHKRPPKTLAAQRKETHHMTDINADASQLIDQVATQTEFFSAFGRDDCARLMTELTTAAGPVVMTDEQIINMLTEFVARKECELVEMWRHRKLVCCG